MENVTLWFAKDKTDEIITIYDISEENSHDYYICPLCGSQVIPKAFKETSKVSSHFAHIDKSKCSSEHMIHWWFKNKLLEVGDEFTVKTFEDKVFKCKDIYVEKPIKTSFGEYRPDLTVTTKCGETIFFEMNYSNKKNVSEYLNMWIEIGNTVVEINTKDIIDIKSLKNWKTIYYNGMNYDNSTIRKPSKLAKYKIKNNLSNNYEYFGRVKKLDWLFNTLHKYKKLSDSNEFLELLHILKEENKKDYDFIISIIKRNHCNDIYEDYCNYVFKKETKELKSYIIENNLFEDFNIAQYSKTDSSNYVYLKVNKGEYSNLICLSRSVENQLLKFKDVVESSIKKKEIDEEYKKYMNNMIANIHETIKKNQMLEKHSKNYKLEYRIFQNYEFLYCLYENNTKIFSSIIKNVNKKNEETIVGIIIDSVENKTNERISDDERLNELNWILENLNKKYSKVFCYKFENYFDKNNGIYELFIIDEYEKELFYYIDNIGIKTNEKYKRKYKNKEDMFNFIIKDFENRAFYSNLILNSKWNKIKDDVYKRIIKFMNSNLLNIVDSLNLYEDSLVLNEKYRIEIDKNSIKLYSFNNDREWLEYEESRKIIKNGISDYVLNEIKNIIYDYETYYSDFYFENAMEFKGNNSQFIYSVKKEKYKTNENVYKILIEDIDGNVYQCKDDYYKNESSNKYKIIDINKAFLYDEELKESEHLFEIKDESLQSIQLALTFKKIKRCKETDIDLIKVVNYLNSHLSYIGEKGKVYSKKIVEDKYLEVSQNIKEMLIDIFECKNRSMYGFILDINKTSDDTGRVRPWLIKKLIEELKRLFVGIKIVNIK